MYKIFKNKAQGCSTPLSQLKLHCTCIYDDDHDDQRSTLYGDFSLISATFSTCTCTFMKSTQTAVTLCAIGILVSALSYIIMKIGQNLK